MSRIWANALVAGSVINLINANIIGLSTQLVDQNFKISKSTGKALDIWTVSNKRKSYYNYDIYNENSRLITIPLDGIYYLSTNILFNYSRSTNLELAFINKNMKNIVYCNNGMEAETRNSTSENTLSISCFIRLRHGTNLELLLKNSEDMAILIGSSISIHYISLPGMTPSMSQPLIKSKERDPFDYRYFNSLSVINDLSKIAVPCDGCYIISVNAVAEFRKESSFRISVSDQEIYNTKVKSNKNQSIIFMQIIKLKKNQEIMLDASDIKFKENSVYSIIMKDCNQNNDIASLPIPEQNISLESDYDGLSNSFTLKPKTNVTFPYFINTFNDKRQPLNIQKSGLFLISLRLYIETPPNLNIQTIITIDDTLDEAEIDMTKGLSSVYSQEQSGNKQILININGVLELRKGSVFNIYFLSTKRHKFSITGNNSISLIPIFGMFYEGKLKIKNLETSTYTCNEDRNFLSRLQPIVNEHETERYLDHTKLSGSSFYKTPMTGTYFVYCEVTISSVSAQSGNISLVFTKDSLQVEKRITKYDTEADSSNIVKITEILELKKNIKIWLKIECTGTIKIRDDIKFNLVYLKSPEETTLILIKNSSLRSHKLDKSLSIHQFEINVAGVYVIHVKLDIYLRNFGKTKNTVKMYIYEISKGKESGTHNKINQQPSNRDKRNAVTLQITDIFKLSSGATMKLEIEFDKEEKVEIGCFEISLFLVTTKYGFKAKENSPKLLQTRQNDANIENLQFVEDKGGFKLESTKFFSGTNLIVQKDMLVFYSVTLELAENYVKEGKYRLYLFVTPSRRNILLSKGTKITQNSLILRSYGTLNFKKGESVEMILETPAGNREVMVQQSSWATIELPDPSLPLQESLFEQATGNIYLESDGKRVQLSNTTGSVGTTSLLIDRNQKIFSIEEWYLHQATGLTQNGDCQPTLIFINNYKTNTSDIKISFKNLTLKVYTRRNKENILLLCLNGLESFMAASQNASESDKILKKHLSFLKIKNAPFTIEAFSAKIEEDQIFYAGEIFKRIDGWSIANYLFFQNSSGFLQSSGLFQIQDDGFYLITITLGIEIIDMKAKCFLNIYKDDVLITGILVKERVIIYNTIIWLQTLQVLQMGLICDNGISEILLKKDSLYAVYLADSHPSMNMACTSGRADLITVPNANEKVFTVRSKLNFTMECFDGRKMVADFQWVYQKGGTSNISKIIETTRGKRKSVLNLQNMQVNETGDYYCSMFVGTTRRKSNAIRIIVFDPVPKLQFSSTIITVEENTIGSRFLAWVKIEVDNPLKEEKANIKLTVEDGDPENRFYFDPEITSSYSNILFRNQFDYEKQKRYNLTIKAVNLDYQAVMHQNMEIRVKNRNDHRPKFLQEQINFTIDENLPVGYKLGQIKAEDLDQKNLQSKQSTLSFKLLPTQFSSLFAINHTSGEIYINGNIDHEVAPFIHLICLVSDGSLVSFQNISIYVKDLNDNFPYFVQTSVLKRFSVDSIPNTKLIDLSAIDKDSGKNGKISFEIIEGNEDEYFYIKESSVYSKKLFEKPMEIQLVIAATDGNSLMSRQPLTIAVSIVDKNLGSKAYPLFEKDHYEFSVEEAGAYPERITRLKFKSNLTVLPDYYLKEISKPGYFMINANGDLIQINQINREEISTLQLIARACVLYPKEIKKKCDDAYITITIIDINDNRPIFSKDIYQVTLKDSIKEGSLVTSVSAYDRDIGNNAAFKYILRNYNDRFRIDQSDGRIFLLKQLNQSVYEIFELYIEARDFGNPSLSSHCYLKIEVLKTVNERFMQNKDNKKVTPLIETWTFWFTVAAVCLLLLAPILIAVVCCKCMWRSRRLKKRLRAEAEKNIISQKEAKEIISNLIKPAESVEVFMAISCETLPSAYNSNKNIASSQSSINGILVHSSEKWDVSDDIVEADSDTDGNSEEPLLHRDGSFDTVRRKHVNGDITRV